MRLVYAFPGMYMLACEGAIRPLVSILIMTILPFTIEIERFELTYDIWKRAIWHWPILNWAIIANRMLRTWWTRWWSLHMRYNHLVALMWLAKVGCVSRPCRWESCRSDVRQETFSSSVWTCLSVQWREIQTEHTCCFSIVQRLGDNRAIVLPFAVWVGSNGGLHNYSIGTAGMIMWNCSQVFSFLPRKGIRPTSLCFFCLSLFSLYIQGTLHIEITIYIVTSWIL